MPNMNTDEAAVFAQQVQDLDLKARTYRRVEEALKKIRDETLRFKHMYDRSDEFVRLQAAALETAKRVIKAYNNRFETLEITIDQLRDQEEGRLEDLLMESESIHVAALKEKDSEIDALKKRLASLNEKNDETSGILQSIQGKDDMIKGLIREKQEYQGKIGKLEQDNAELRVSLVSAQEAKLASDVEAEVQTNSLLAIKAEFNSLKDEVAELVTKMDDDSKSEDLVAEIIVQNEKLTDENANLRNELTQLRMGRNSKHSDEELSRLIDDLKSKLAGETKKVSRLETQLKRIMDELRITVHYNPGDNSIQNKYDAKLNMIRETYEIEIGKLEDEMVKQSNRCVELEGYIRNLLIREEDNQKLLKLREEVIHLDEQLLSAYQI